MVKLVFFFFIGFESLLLHPMSMWSCSRWQIGSLFKVRRRDFLRMSLKSLKVSLRAIILKIFLLKFIFENSVEGLDLPLLGNA
jgi:hypothetical protein